METRRGGTMRELLLIIGMALALMWPGPSYGEVDETELMATMDTIWAGQLTNTDGLDEFNCLQLRILRNTIYARHGFDFTNEWVSGHFEGDPRYVRDEHVDSSTVGPMLTPSDHTTVEAILATENEHHCKAFWDKYGDPNGDSVLPPPGQRDTAEDAPREYFFVEVFVDREQTISVLAFDAIPHTIYDWVMDGEVLEAEWIEPFDCEELERTEQAVYARHDYPFGDQTGYYFASFKESY